VRGRYAQGFRKCGRALSLDDVGMRHGLSLP
jgi:hypothetical protein